MDIRGFQVEEQDQVVTLWRACGLVVPHNDPVKDIRRKLEVDPDLFLVGTLDGQVVASVMGGYEGHRGWINYLAVSPDHQRKGFGRQMMVAIERAIAARGCPKINLQVREGNDQVVAFYKALGYFPDHAICLGKRIEHDV
ncbi:MAG: GNAT family acetyltransferase [Alteromonadaceae bacterium]|nr:GNAT family acetyltransferase [Alteromonadaceae bacterium]MBH85021.1 GNAT family acetyltransferase [Alteromonadaceae bacterium]|tara:strand:- start:38 stop:457 length:420 start_codon:yes stop_codon:yes gene_type:complete